MLVLSNKFCKVEECKELEQEEKIKVMIKSNNVTPYLPDASPLAQKIPESGNDVRNHLEFNLAQAFESKYIRMMDTVGKLNSV